EGHRAFGCNRWRDGCGFTIWKTMAGKRLPKAAVKRLIDQGHTDPIDGFKSKADKPFSASLRLDANGKVGFDFERAREGGNGDLGNPFAEPQTSTPTNTLASIPTETATSTSADTQSNTIGPTPSEASLASAQSLRDNPLQCPKCRQGQLIEGHRAFGCNRWREGCDFTVPKQIDGQPLTDSELRNLFAKG
ncbi:MAG: topoisomerase C-terminal repeat-containing protein, partial [Thiohalocapsa sp.]